MKYSRTMALGSSKSLCCAKRHVIFLSSLESAGQSPRASHLLEVLLFKVVGDVLIRDRELNIVTPQVLRAISLPRETN